MAGGVWYLREWDDWLDNPELGPVAFQFGTRPLLTQESPISDAWKRGCSTLQEGDVCCTISARPGSIPRRCSNGFIEELCERARSADRLLPSSAVGEHIGRTCQSARADALVYVTPH